MNNYQCDFNSVQSAPPLLPRNPVDSKKLQLCFDELGDAVYVTQPMYSSIIVQVDYAPSFTLWLDVNNGLPPLSWPYFQMRDLPCSVCEPLGNGKHSTVYKGRKKKTIHYYAIKKIDMTQRERVQQEVSPHRQGQGPQAAGRMTIYDCVTARFPDTQNLEGPDLQKGTLRRAPVQFSVFVFWTKR